MTSIPGTAAQHPVRKVALTLFLSILLFLGVETALQVRSHIRHGQSVFNVLTSETRYVVDERTGLKTLRPNHVFHGEQIVIRTNSLGLRSPEIAATKPAATFRIAIVGASTVMGAYASSNEETFSHQLETLLNRRDGATKYEVINAGIAGYGLSEQTRMIESIVMPLSPDLIVVYPGFNDFGGYCSDSTSKPDSPQPQRHGLPLLQTPNWLLTMDLIQKNTVGLRTPPTNRTRYNSVDTLDLEPYQRKIEELVQTVERFGVPLVLSTNARAYRPEQTPDEQLKLSETARYYNPCFDLAGLNALYDAHNRVIVESAQRHGRVAIPLGSLIPGGREYFVDSSHFSNRGEQAAAIHLQQFLLDHALVPTH